MAALLVLAVCPTIAEGPVTPVIVEELPEWLSAPSQQEKTEGIVCGDFEYQLLDDGTAGIIAYTGRDKLLTLPDVLDGVPVSAIGTRAFSGNGKLTEVVIPEGITHLGNAAFSSCRKLTSVTLPSTMTYISPSMFYNNFALESLTIPEGVHQIDPYALFCCNSLKEIVIPEGVTLLDEFVLAECTGLERITLPDSLTEIRESSLYGSAIPSPIM